MPGTVTPGSAGAVPHGSSTVVAPVGSQTKPTVFSKAAMVMRRVFATSQDLRADDGTLDVGRLWRALHQLEENLTRFLVPVAELPFLTGAYHTGLSFTPGQTQNINHRLGRPWRGFFPVNASGSFPQLISVALPSGVTTAQMIALQHTGAATANLDLWIF